MRITPMAIALAAIGSASLAHAQTQVEVYGVVDGYVEAYDNGAETTGRVGSGGKAGSRLGFRGTEQLGGGLAAYFSLESGILLDNGKSTPDNPSGSGYLFQREALVGLRGGFGSLSLGRQYTPHFMALAMNDPAGLGMSSAINYFASPSASGINGGPGADGTTRRDNSLVYATPKFAGVQATVLASAGETKDVAGSPSNKVGNAYNLGLRYAQGALSANFSYLIQQPLYRNVLGDEGKDKFLTVSAAYDFGLVKPAVTYAKKDSKDSVAAPDVSAWQIGASAPLLGGRLIGTFAMIKNDSQAEADASAWGMRYDYPLSKRTTLYGGVTGISNEQFATYAISGGGGSSAPIAGAPGADPRSLYAGISHSF